MQITNKICATASCLQHWRDMKKWCRKMLANKGHLFLGFLLLTLMWTSSLLKSTTKKMKCKSTWMFCEKSSYHFASNYHQFSICAHQSQTLLDFEWRPQSIISWQFSRWSASKTKAKYLYVLTSFITDELLPCVDCNSFHLIFHWKSALICIRFTCVRPTSTFVFNHFPFYMTFVCYYS